MSSFKLNRKGIQALLTDDALLPVLKGEAERIAAAANAGDRHNPGEPDGYIAHLDPGTRRHRAAVVTGTQAAKANEARHQTMLKAALGG